MNGPLCQILSQQTFTHFLTFMSKNPQHDCVKKQPIWYKTASLSMDDKYVINVTFSDILTLPYNLHAQRYLFLIVLLSPKSSNIKNG